MAESHEIPGSPEEVIDSCAKSGDIERAEHWLLELQRCSLCTGHDRRLYHHVLLAQWGFYVPIYIYIHVCTRISLSLYKYITHIYIYIYTCTHTHTYIYIYIYIYGACRIFSVFMPWWFRFAAASWPPFFSRSCRCRADALLELLDQNLIEISKFLVHIFNLIKISRAIAVRIMDKPGLFGLLLGKIVALVGAKYGPLTHHCLHGRPLRGSHCRSRWPPAP